MAALLFGVCAFPSLLHLHTIPSDWAAAAARSDLLYTLDDQEAKDELRATISNGYVGWRLDSNIMYVAGVFNGPNGTFKSPSHRAAVTAPLNLRLAGELSANGSALDLRGAVYRRRSARLEQRWYAHRARRHLLVHELQNLGADNAAATLTGGVAAGITKKDIKFALSAANVTRPDGTRVEVDVMVGATRVTESPSASKVTVAVVSTRVPRTAFVLTPGATRSFYAVVRTSLDAADPKADALAEFAALPSASDLAASHADAWRALWSGGLEVEGRPDVARAINASLYYILSSVRADTPFSLSPGGLPSNAYLGHAFWDCETWMFPPLLLWHPPIARSLLQYRHDRIPQAREKAKSYNPPYDGAMWPWESAFSGVEACPSTAPTGELEQHITGDIAFAARQYYAATANASWLSSEGYALASGAADFFVSKATIGTDAAGVPHLLHVIPPDEYATCDDSVYTNAVAQIALDFATRAAAVVGEAADPRWANISARLPLLFDAKRQYHPECKQYKRGDTIKQADVVLLAYPLMVEMADAVRDNDLAVYEKVTDANGPAMTWGMHAVGHLEGGDVAKAASLFNRSFANVKPPFAVWTETPTGGATNFLTGAGGFLQAALAGYVGLRLHDDHIRLRPQLIEGATAIAARGLRYRGLGFDVRFDAAQLTVTLADVSGGSVLVVAAKGGAAQRLAKAGEAAAFALGAAPVEFAVSVEGKS